MKALLGGVFVFFGIHTLLWFPRSLQVRRQRAQQPGDAPDDRLGGSPSQES